MNVVYTDPKQLDGDCFEVAGAAFQQAENLTILMKSAIVDCFKMARLAEMERQLQQGDDPDGAGFVSSPQGKKLVALEHAAYGMGVALKRLRQAAEYDPSHRPKEEYENVSTED